jgi:hypothetical protein
MEKNTDPTKDLSHTPGTRRGEDIVKDEGKEPGRHDTGTKGQSQRRTGKSTPRDFTSVDVPDDITKKDRKH